MQAPVTNAESIVRLEGIAKRFETTVAVERLDLAIGRGEFVTLLGPSGCGKSTTLRMIGGFERPSEGRIVLDGVDVTALPPNKRPVNMVFQDYALFPHMNVAKNVAFGLELQGLSRPAIEARMSELLAFLELSELKGRMPDALSGGQRQRVALARALAPDPKLLLLDEPLGALDAKLRGQLQVELKGIQRRTGKTFVFVTHDQDEALTMSDRIIVMNAGRVEQDGTPEALYDHPASRFVAEFVGETNLLEGVVEAVSGSGVTVRVGEASLIGRAVREAPARGADVVACVRPEKVRVGAAAAELPNRLEARVTERIFKGSRTMVHLEVDAATVLRASVEPQDAPEVGAMTPVAFAADALTVMDA